MLWRRLYLDSKEHHGVLAHQLQDVGQRQVCDVDVILLRVEHEHQTLHGGHQVLVGQDDALGSSCRAGSVHHDGGVVRGRGAELDVLTSVALKEKEGSDIIYGNKVSGLNWFQN